MSTLDLSAAARLLLVHPKTLQRLARFGLVPACKIGRAWVFVEALLIDHLKAQSVARLCSAGAGGSECLSTGVKTRPSGGSKSPSVDEQYNAALGLKIKPKLRNTMTR